MAVNYHWEELDLDSWFAETEDIRAWFDNEWYDYTAGVSSTPITLGATEQADTAAVTINVNVTIGATEGPDVASLTVQGNVVIGATEAPDVVAITVQGNVVIGATEGPDVAALAFSLDAIPFTMAATEGADTASLTINANVVVGATEAPDVAAMTVQGTVVLGATEGPDVTAMTVNVNVIIGATEQSDTASFAFEGVVAGATYQGGTWRRRKPAKDPFFLLDELLDEYSTVFSEEIVDELEEIVADHAALIKKPVKVPETSKGIPKAVKDYTGLQSLIAKAKADILDSMQVQNKQRYYEAAEKILDTLKRANEKLLREEEEIVILITLEIL